MRPTIGSCSIVFGFLFALLAGGASAAAQPAPDDAPSTAPVLRFTNLSLDEGLSVTGVSSVLQDRHGFMWIGTQDGLNRYDGHRITVFRPVAFDTTSLSDAVIYALAEDSAGALWVSTLNTLERRDPRTGHFKSFPYEWNSPSAPAGRSRALLASPDGTLWAGTLTSGLDRFDPATGRFTHIRHRPGDPASLSSDAVTALLRSADGTLWVATTNGLNRMHPLPPESSAGHEYTFDRFLHDASRPTDDYLVASLLNNVPAPAALRSSVITALIEDPRTPGVLWVGTQAGLVRLDIHTGVSRTYAPPSGEFVPPVFVSLAADPNLPGVIWAATMASGLYRFDAHAGRFDAYRHDRRERSSLSSDGLVQLYADRSGLIWSVCFFNGVDRFNPAGLPFAHERRIPESANGLIENTVWGLAEDSAGRLWISTQGGLDRLDPKTGAYTHFRHDPANPRTPSSDEGFAVHVDSKGVVWYGTTTTGIDRIDSAGHRLEHFENDSRDSTGLTPGAIFVIYEDAAGTLWAGTSRGLNRFDADRRRFTRVPLDADAGRSLVVLDLFEDSSGGFWVATSEGLRRLDRRSGSVSVYRHDASDRSGLSSDIVMTIHEREREPGVLWLGTADSGLDRFDVTTGRTTHFREADGLPNVCIYGILEDDRGHLWLSTNNGISDFNPDTRTFVNYGSEDGLQSREFNQNAYFRSERTGEMYFGGINGFNRFQPDHFQRNLQPPDVVLTGLRLFHSPIEVNERGILSAPIWEANEVRLKALHRSVTLEFVALHYQNPAKNRTAYRLDGFDADWIDAGENLAATYTNLDPGHYTFRVRAANSDNIWNESGAAIDVVVLPPWYRTVWALGAYGLLLLAAAFGAHRVHHRRLQASERARQQLEERVRERTSQLEAANRELESFSYSVSHDLRSPLRAIEGFSRILVDEHEHALDHEGRGYLERVRSNVLRMGTLIDNLLEFSRVGRHAQKTDVVSTNEVVRQVIDDLSHSINGRSVNITIGDLPPCVGDATLLRQVYANLLGNAIKFTRGCEQAQIEVCGVKRGDFVHYHVADNGVGFDMQFAEKLFGVFQRLHHADEFEGTGVGLAIVDRIIRRHGGETRAEAEPGSGATFYFTVPASKEERL